MACLICERSATYELVRDGEAEAEVCEACTVEFLAVDEGDPTCVYCDRPGVYDVRTGADGGFPDAETTGDTFATPYESVLCEEHFAELGDEEPAGSPEAADEADVEDEGETDDETPEEAEAEAEAEAETAAEADAERTGDDADAATEADDDTEDTEDTGDAEIEAEQDPDGGSDATTKAEGDVTDRDS